MCTAPAPRDIVPLTYAVCESMVCPKDIQHILTASDRSGYASANKPMRAVSGCQISGRQARAGARTDSDLGQGDEASVQICTAGAMRVPTADGRHAMRGDGSDGVRQGHIYT